MLRPVPEAGRLFLKYLKLETTIQEQQITQLPLNWAYLELQTLALLCSEQSKKTLSKFFLAEDWARIRLCERALQRVFTQVSSRPIVSKKIENSFLCVQSHDK